MYWNSDRFLIKSNVFIKAIFLILLLFQFSCSISIKTTEVKKTKMDSAGKNHPVSYVRDLIDDMISFGLAKTRG